MDNQLCPFVNMMANAIDECVKPDKYNVLYRDKLYELYKHLNGHLL